MLEEFLIRDQGLTRENILQDDRLAYQTRQVSIVGRREVMGGKAKFGIFGDGKELAQIAMAKVFRNGDFRSGYYRDQTLMFAIGATSFQEFFSQLYANPDVRADPASAGRAMNAHFATRSLNPDGSWKNLINVVNSSADVSPTGSQMPRLVGLAYASRLYREIPELRGLKQFSVNGNEIAFGTIGNATTAEGMFWEAINAMVWYMLLLSFRFTTTAMASLYPMSIRNGIFVCWSSTRNTNDIRLSSSFFYIGHQTKK